MFNKGDLVEFIPLKEYKEYQAEQRQAIFTHGVGPFTVIDPPVGDGLMGVLGDKGKIYLFAYRFRLVATPLVSLDELM